MTPKSIYAANDLLGEGPVWHVEEQALYWVDILNKRLQRFDPTTSRYDDWLLPSEIGSFAFCKSGEVLAALKTGFAFFDLATNSIEYTVDPEEDKPLNRFNDGKCDRQGRFWAGSIGDGNEASAAFYRLDAPSSYTTIRNNVIVSNGLAWSPDNSTMYYTDSGTQTIYAFDFDAVSGILSNERIFAKVEDGFPDGLTIDTEGCIWSAVWDGWRVDNYAPDGTLLNQISMPVQRPTSCMFGGKDLNELFITSASVDLSEEELAKQPEAGHVFSIETESRGIPEPVFLGR